MHGKICSVSGADTIRHQDFDTWLLRFLGFYNEIVVILVPLAFGLSIGLDERTTNIKNGIRPANTRICDDDITRFTWRALDGSFKHRRLV
jgi:hypothetical protein